MRPISLTASALVLAACFSHAAQAASAGSQSGTAAGDPRVHQVAYNMPMDDQPRASPVQGDAPASGQTPAIQAPESDLTQSLAGVAAGLLLIAFVSRRRRDQI
jgi:hypothetical protein